MKFCNIAIALAFLSSFSSSSFLSSTTGGGGAFLASAYQFDRANCKEHTVDFIVVEGDAIRTSVENEIVQMLKEVGVNVNTRLLSKEEFNRAEQDGDFHLSFSETWGKPYSPHAYTKGWVAKDEGHYEALASLESPDSRESLFSQIDDVLQEESHTERALKWNDIFDVVHQNAVMLPLWGSRIPTVMNSNKILSTNEFQAGNQQFDYPVHKLELVDGLEGAEVTIAPGAQTGLFQTIGRLDPHTYRPNEFFANNWVYEGLVKYGKNGQILPALAKSWSLSEDGKEYTFMLRENVLFHDGAEWNCDVAKLNFDHVLAGALRSPDWHGWYGLMEQIESWECASDSEFLIRTKNKYYPFLQELSFIRPLRMLSPRAFVGNADPYKENSCHVGWGNITSSTDEEETVHCKGITNISGTGPFMFESRTQMTLEDDDTTVVDTEVVFKANPTYWEGAPKIETLKIKRYSSSQEVKENLLEKKLDLVWGSGVLSAQDLIDLDQDEFNDLNVYHSDDIQNVILLLNSGKAPLDDINLRKTIIHAINKKTIIDNELGGLFKPVDNIFPNDAPYCDVSLTPRWDYDIEKALYLNCLPDLVNVEAEAEATEATEATGVRQESTTSSDESSAMAIGLGLGITSVVLFVVAFVYCQRSKSLQQEIELLRKEGATEA